MGSGDSPQSQQNERYQYIIENIRDVIWELDREFRFTFISPNVVEMAGYQPEEMLGRKLADFLTEVSKEYFLEQVRIRLARRDDPAQAENALHDVQFICKNGFIKWVQVSARLIRKNGEFTGYIGTTRDIMERKEYEYQLNQYVQELKKINTELEKSATVDALTGSYNRRKFEDDLDMLVSQARQAPHDFSIIFFDIDRFKSVNDHHGHPTGDRVLQRIAQLVMANIRKTDRLFRWGGEEFTILLYDTKLEDARSVAEKIRRLIANEDFGVEKKITISFGVCQYREPENADQIVARADKTLYQAKVQGGNRVIC
jgi:diguanylate cyclase (GGDEF)-like protein/PAS domain S-box-containing protein